MKKTLLIIFGFLILGAGGLYFWKKSNEYQKPLVPGQVSIRDVVGGEESSTQEDVVDDDAVSETQGEGEEVVPIEELPEELNLAAPFYSQAPFGNWDYPWQEACEEASILLVANAYFEHEWTAEEFNEQILELVDWQNDVFGDYWHTDMPQTARMLNEVLGLETVIHEDPTLEDVKRLLAKGHLLVMPFDGKAMNNPFFSNGGPEYHVVMVKGYTADDGIITHDVGTRRGADYVYSWEVLDGALHDYVAGQPIQEGPRRFIEVLPPDFESDL